MIVLVAVAAVLVALLLRAPTWLAGALMGVAIVLTAGTLIMGGLDRGRAPLILMAVALGLVRMFA